MNAKPRSNVACPSCGCLFTRMEDAMICCTPLLEWKPGWACGECLAPWETEEEANDCCPPCKNCGKPHIPWHYVPKATCLEFAL